MTDNPLAGRVSSEVLSAVLSFYSGDDFGVGLNYSPTPEDRLIHPLLESLQKVSLIMHLEDSLGIVISPEDEDNLILGKTTVSDFVQFVLKQHQQKDQK